MALFQPPSYVAVGAAGYATFAAAVAAIDTTVSTLILPAGTHTVSSDLTVPSNVCLNAVRGVTISVATGTTLTINGCFMAGDYPVFSLAGTGKVLFGSGACSEVKAIWFGTDPTGSADSAAAINAAIDSVYQAVVSEATVPSKIRRVYLSPGTYKVTSRIRTRFNVTLSGDSVYNTIIKPANTFPADKTSYGYGVLWAGYLESESSISTWLCRDWCFAENLKIDLRSIPNDTTIAGIWFFQNGRRSLVKNIDIVGTSTGNICIGVHEQYNQCAEDGSELAGPVQNTHNTARIESTRFFWLANTNGALYVEQNPDAELQEFKSLQFSNCQLNVNYGGYQSSFIHCGFTGVTNQWHNDNSGGFYPRVKIYNPTVTFRDCYWDGGEADVLIQGQYGSYGGSGTESFVNLEGFNAGFTDPPTPNLQFTIENEDGSDGLWEVTRTSDYVLTYAGNATTDRCAIWSGGGVYIVVKTTSVDRYKYYVDSATYNVGPNTTTINLSSTKYAPGEAAPPALPADVTHFWRLNAMPFYGNYKSGYTTTTLAQIANKLKVGGGITGDSLAAGGSPAGDYVTQIKNSTVAYDVGTINTGATSDESITVADIQAGSAVIVAPNGATEAAKITAGVKIDYAYTAAGAIHLVITNGAGSNWTPGSITWKYTVFK